jgi:hypothetical protein
MKTSKRTRLSAASGMTLIEVVISAALLTLVIGSLVMVSQASGRAYRTGALASELELRAAAVTERIVTELRTVVFESLVPDPEVVGAERIEYVQATGMTGVDIEQSALRRLAFEYEIGELNDGLDNNGNGLVDEGRLILTENVGEVNERSRVLTRWVAERLEGELENGLDDNGNDLVDESGFVLERIGESLTVRMTLQKVDQGGRLMTRSIRTSVRLRN